MRSCQRLRHSRGASWSLPAVLAVAVGLAGLVSSERALAANTLIVGPPGCSGAMYSTIQAAVDAAAAGDTIQVCNGTYSEQVVIGPGKDNLTIQSQSALGATIKAPATLPQTQDSAIVQVNRAAGVTINGFAISGPAPTGTGAIGFGVLIDGGGSLSLNGNHITAIRDDPLSGAQNGIAVEVGDGPNHPVAPTPGSVIATNNRIDDYQKGGFSIRRPGSMATITGNTITGAGPTATIAQNGIFVRDDTIVAISNNTISGNAYSQGALSTAIAVVGGQVVASGNTLNANDYGIETFLAQGTAIRSNTVTGGAYGIAIFNSTNVLVGTNTTADQAKAGLYAEDDPSGGQSSGNSFLNNTATGVSGDGNYDCLDITTGGATAGTANTWLNNVGDTRKPEGICSTTKLDENVPPVIVIPPAGAPPVRPRPPVQEAGDEVIAKMRRNKLQACVIEVRTLEPKKVLIARGVAHAPPKGAGRLIIRLHVRPKGSKLLEKTFGGVTVNVRALCRSTSGTLHGASKSVRAVLLIEHALTPPGSWVPDQPVLTGIGKRFMQHLRQRMIAVRFVRCDGYTATWPPSPAHPPTLSLQRARVVCTSLKRAGARAHVKLVPHGLTDPIATNSTEAGRRINRRVAVTIVHVRVFRP